MDFHKIFYDNEPFTESAGWLNRWKIQNWPTLNITGEELSADSEEVIKFGVKFQKLTKENSLCEDNLFNCVETGLNFHMLRLKIIAAKKKSISSWI